jgi:hypothetical protein
MSMIISRGGPKPKGAYTMWDAMSGQSEYELKWMQPRHKMPRLDWIRLDSILLTPTRYITSVIEMAH